MLPALKKFFTSKLFALLCVGLAVLGIFFFSDKDISPLIPLLLVLIPIMINTATNRGTSEAGVAAVQDLQASTSTDTNHLIEEIHGIYNAMEQLKLDNQELKTGQEALRVENAELKEETKQLKQEVTTLRRENRQLKQMISTFTHDDTAPTPTIQ